jgi:Domain of unknown function (DUF4367)
MNDDFIQQFDPPGPPRPKFTAALYQRISQPMKTTTRTRVLRAVALSLATVAVIAAVLFFSRSARAFAASIIQQFGVGGYTFVQGTAQPPTVSPEQQATLQAQAFGDHLMINEQMYRPGEPNTVLNRPEIQAVTVRGQSGAWMPTGGGKNMLAWEENSITYMIVSNTLSKDEVLKVAESLGK